MNTWSLFCSSRISSSFAPAAMKTCATGGGEARGGEAGGGEAGGGEAGGGEAGGEDEGGDGGRR